jgi:hypothetical protein
MHNVLARAPRAFATQVLPTGTESGWGQKRTSRLAGAMSARPPKADISASRHQVGLGVQRVHTPLML